MNPNLQQIAKHLRTAEEFALARRFSEALIELEYVFQIDPRNYNGRTLQDRIRTLQKKQEEAPRQQGPEFLTKEEIYELIRIAEYHLQGGRFDKALMETERILESDSLNYQARSLAERIRAYKKKAEQAQQERAEVRAQKLDDRIEEIAPLLREADRFIQLREFQSALERVAKVFAIDSTNHLARAYSQTIESLMNAPAATAAQPTPPGVSSAPPAPLPPAAVPPKEAQLPTEVPDEPVGRLLMYREILNEMWSDGMLTEKESVALNKVRGLFDITEEQHAQLEKEIKIDAYAEALRIVLHDGVVNENEDRILELMRKRYGITNEEHEEAQRKILAMKRSRRTQGLILVVDDEKTTLLTYAAILRRHGYAVLTAETVEDAMAILGKETPSLILSDVVFASTSQGGFEFYNQVRSIERFNHVPFLLMSGISDEYVVRAGVRLGVDAYLIKPFSNDVLLATIEGKLRGL